MCHAWRRHQRRFRLWVVGAAGIVHAPVRSDAVRERCGDTAERERGPEEEPGAEPHAIDVGEQGGEGAEGTVRLSS